MGPNHPWVKGSFGGRAAAPSRPPRGQPSLLSRPFRLPQVGEGDGDQSSVASAPKTPEPGGAGNRATDGRQPETARAWAGGVSRASRKWWRWGSTPRPLSGLGSGRGRSAEKRQLHSHVLLGGSRAGAGASSPTPASEQASRAGCVRRSVVMCALGDGSARSSPVGASLCHRGGGGGGGCGSLRKAVVGKSRCKELGKWSAHNNCVLST